MLIDSPVVEWVCLFSLQIYILLLVMMVSCPWSLSSLLGRVGFDGYLRPPSQGFLSMVVDVVHYKINLVNKNILNRIILIRRSYNKRNNQQRDETIVMFLSIYLGTIIIFITRTPPRKLIANCNYLSLFLWAGQRSSSDIQM